MGLLYLLHKERWLLCIKTNIMIISRSVLLRIRNVSDNFYRKSKHIFYVQKIFSENLLFFEIMWKNMLHPDMPQ